MPKMHGLLEKILEQNAREERERIFHYSSYWGTWSRILSREIRGKYKALSIIEVNLTPIRNCHSSEWQKDVAPIVFREHGTMPGNSDKFERELPDYILEQMREHLGITLTQRLLTEDFLKVVDVEKIRVGKIGGGGIGLSHVLK